MTMATVFHPMSEAKRDGTTILICVPGGQSDHYYPVCWADTEELLADLDAPSDRLLSAIREAGGAWQCPWRPDMVLTEAEIAANHLQPMWCELPIPPTSLCAQ